MQRENGDTVEDALCSGIRLSKLELQGVRTKLVDTDGLAGYCQKIALRSVDAFVQVNPETEKYIVSAKRVAI